jgi:hypothetical protein
VSQRWKYIKKGSYNMTERLVAGENTLDATADAIALGATADAIDPRAWLPDLRLAYGLKVKEGGMEKLLARSKANGLVLRTAKYQYDSYGIQRQLRELMLCGLAASRGCGPRVFAAWVAPENGFSFTPKMNVGDPHEHFGDGVTTPKYEPNTVEDGEGISKLSWPKGPHWSQPWGADYDPATERVSNKGENGDAVRRVVPPQNFAEARDGRAKWRRMYVLMEGFQGTVDQLTVTAGIDQVKKATDAIWQQCERMGATGFLHGDLKGGNMVARTWREDGQPVTDATPWDQCEVRAIDFDPYYVKVCPFVPADVLTLINAAGMFSTMRCFDRPNAMPIIKHADGRIKTLVKKINEKYPQDDAPFAAAFRALPVTYSTSQGPDFMQRAKPGLGARNPHAGKPPQFQMLNDEFEAARAFRKYVKNYLENRCMSAGYRNDDAPEDTPALARLLSYIKHGSQRKVNKIVRDPARPEEMLYAPVAPATPAAEAVVPPPGAASAK